MINGVDSYNYYATLLSYSNLDTNTKVMESLLSQNRSSIYDVDKTDISYLEDFRAQISNLEEVSETLVASESDSVFNERVASTSDPDVVTAQADLSAEKTTYDIDINQLAVAQQNTSAQFDSDALNNFTTGDNTFKISQGGETVELTVNVESTDNNADVLDKMKTKINEANLDVTAEVETNTDGTSSLQITSDKVGTNDEFSISDVSGDLVAQTGAGTVSRQAQDADYTINGTSYLTSSNEITLDEDRLTLQLEGTGTAEVEVSDDPEAIKESVKTFVEEYNNTLEFLRSDMSNNDALELADSIADIAQYEERDLKDIGINVSDNGTLSLDEDEFAANLEENKDLVTETIGGETGFVSQVERKTENVLSNSISKYMNWANQDSLTDDFSNFNTYTNMGQLISPFQSMQPGMLFDFYL